MINCPFCTNKFGMHNYSKGEYYCPACGHYFISNTSTAAIEKQIPKKPQKFYTTPYYRCPICGNAVMASPYCKWCGQDLDWSDIE